MSDVRRAILTGTLEAERAHEKFNSQSRWKRDGARIDVFGAIDELGIPVMFQPMEGLLGAYLAQPSPGVLVNTRRPPAVRRYTAAHELGHHWLGHEPSLDGDEMIARMPFASRVTYDAREVEADAFAITFLIPDWFVYGEMRRRNWTFKNMENPSSVYQLALRAGTSYQATCYALQRYRVINAQICSQLVGVKLKSIKQATVPNYDPDNWHIDTWQICEADNGLFIEASPRDVFRISLTEHSGAGYMWDIGGILESDFELLEDGRQRIDPDDAVGGHVFRHVVARAKSAGFGSIQFVERQPWERKSDSLKAFRFSYDISEIAQPGLLSIQRERMLGGNA